jgi:ribosome modulation factor
VSGSSFQNLLRRADTCRRTETDPIRRDWWGGYMRGLRRAQYGDSYGTAEQHEQWLALVGDVDPARDALGRGYRAGLTLTSRDPD